MGTQKLSPCDYIPPVSGHTPWQQVTVPRAAFGPGYSHPGPITATRGEQTPWGWSPAMLVGMGWGTWKLSSGLWRLPSSWVDCVSLTPWLRKDSFPKRKKLYLSRLRAEIKNSYSSRSLLLLPVFIDVTVELRLHNHATCVKSAKYHMLLGLAVCFVLLEARPEKTHSMPSSK